MIQRPSSSAATYEVPERSGDVLIDPPPERLPAMLEVWRDAAWGGTEILGVPLGELRRRARERALSIARRAGGIPRGGERGASRAGPFVVMGHQPVFFHPGVWFKFFLLTRLHERFGAEGLYLVVDTDASGPITAEVPAEVDHLARHTETLVDLPSDVPLEAAPLPTEREWEAFCTRVRGHLSTLAAAGVRACFETFAAGASPARASAQTLGEFLTAARRTYEAQAGPPGYEEVAVSALSDTPEFGAFALHLMQDAAGFRKRYNASLEEYRRIHRLRSSANPFPNLGELDGYEEAPFWVVRGGRRATLFVQRRGDRLRLRTPAAPLLDVPAGPAGLDALRGSDLRLRPRALTLTMFARVCLGDLSIHGVSGGRYDRVTDAVIGQVLGCAPPPYIVATATLWLPLLGNGAAGEDGRTLEGRLMDLRHNPERYLAAPSEAERRLVDEKWALIRSVEQMRRGSARRDATHRIREVNRTLAQRLSDEIHRVQAQLAAWGPGSAAWEAASYRGYPFFLFDPAQVGALAGVAP